MTKIVNPQDQAGVPLAPITTSVISTNRPATLSLGGIVAGTTYQGQSAADILTTALFRYISPTVGITATKRAPNNGVLLSTNANYTINIDLTATITRQSALLEELTTLEFLYNGTVIRTVNVGSTLVHNYTHQIITNPTEPSITSIAFTARLTFNKSGVPTKYTSPSSPIAIQFVHPTYIGVLPVGTDPETTFFTLGQVLTYGNTITKTLTDVGYGTLVLAVPQVPAFIPRVFLDQNGHNLLTAMDVVTDVVNDFGVPYRLYTISDTYGYVGSWTLQF